MLFLLLLFPLLIHPTVATPTPQMCASFAKFAEKWNSLPETLLNWSKSNCELIQPRPDDMSCADIVQFVADCHFEKGGAGPQFPSNRGLASEYYQKMYGNNPRVLGKYIYYNENTARDYGKFGNWYYPNYYPPTYLGWFDGRADSVAQLENDYKFAKSGHYPYDRADNVVNIALQQTSLPTCLHDLFYCVRAANPSPYQKYYNEQQYNKMHPTTPAPHHTHRRHHRRHHHSDSSYE